MDRVNGLASAWLTSISRADEPFTMSAYITETRVSTLYFNPPSKKISTRILYSFNENLEVEAIAGSHYEYPPHQDALDRLQLITIGGRETPSLCSTNVLVQCPRWGIVVIHGAQKLPCMSVARVCGCCDRILESLEIRMRNQG